MSHKLSRDQDNDYIVIPRSVLMIAVVGVGAFLLGGLVGYLMATANYQRGSDETLAAVQTALAGADTTGEAGQPQPTALPQRIDVSLDDDPALGPADAPVVIVEFADFRCPYCRRFRDETLPALLEQYGDQLRFVYRDYPVVGGEMAAEAAECADEQGDFWPYHNGIGDPQQFNNVDAFVELAGNLSLDTQQFRECLESGRYSGEVQGDVSDARSYGVTGTPTFFVNGIRVIGAQPLAVFQSVIDQELAGQR